MVRSVRSNRTKSNKTITALGEEGVIAFFARGVPKRTGDLICGIGDDAAVVRARAPLWLVTTDLMQDGIHFESRWDLWDHVGYKALQVNVSDIAAMGGIPVWYWLTLSLPPRFSLQTLQALRRGMRRAERETGLVCAGGDTNRAAGPVAIDVTMLGRAARRIAYRHGARPGDDLYITGRLGEAALGLALLRKRFHKTAFARSFCRRQTAPSARLIAGQQLTAAGLVHAMIDISDGLNADLARLLTASGVGAEIELTALHPQPSFRRLCRRLRLDPWQLILGGGDDYELLFAAPAGQRKKVATLEKKLSLSITRIGTIVRRRGIRYRDTGGRRALSDVTGYEHFRTTRR